MNRRTFFKNSIFASVFGALVPNMFAKAASTPKVIEMPSSIKSTSIIDDIKKDVEKVLRSYRGELNDSVTHQNASRSVSDMLSTKYHQKRLIYSYYVVIDETNNSPLVVESGIMRGDVYINFYNSVEYVVLRCTIV